MSFNPKREFVVQKNISEIKDAILKVQRIYNQDYKYESSNDILNHIRLLKPAQIGDLLGYYIDFTLVKQTSDETKITLEISRRGGMINTEYESASASGILNSLLPRLSNALNGTIDQVSSQEFATRKKQNKSMQTVLLVLIAILILGMVLFVLSHRV